MEAGKLDRRISIERATETTDAVGGVVLNWSSIATVWAGMRPKFGDEKFAVSETAAVADTIFTIRDWPIVLPTDRVIYKDRVYSIRRVDEIGRNEGQEITASSRAD